MKLKHTLLLCIALSIGTTAHAITLNEAKKLYLKGEYAKALPVFTENLKRNPKNASLNQWVGACLFETGKKEEAVKYLKFAESRNIAEASRYLAQIALLDLNYQEAKELIDNFEEQIDYDDSKISAHAAMEKDRIKRAGAMLNNVEKIQIIDSLTVDKTRFFEYYKISPEAGAICRIDTLPFAKPEIETSVFIPESRSRMMWAMPDSTGKIRIAETYKLNTGKWDKPTLLNADLNDNGDANYPFMMPDGTTLYYACNGDNSIGGYDIYMSRKDLDSGEYLQPQNIGMPYNSPYDDYLLVIDEMTGAGWWATDRNQIPDKLTIYIFIPNSMRENYDPELDNISSLASVRSIKDSWAEGADYTSQLNEIAAITPEDQPEESDFLFHVTNDITYTTYEDFRSSEAKSMMQKYVKTDNFLKEVATQLAGLRKEFHKANASKRALISSKIITLERTIIKNREEMHRLENEIRASEIPALNK